MTTATTSVIPLRWVGEVHGVVQMLDQRLLPGEETWHTWRGADEVAQSITDMVVRGAPAIGIAAAYGVVLGVRDLGHLPGQDERDALRKLLAETRPTAVNLFWALDRMLGIVQAFDGPHAELVARLLEEAHTIGRDDRENNLAMGRHGAALFGDNVRILTHCNTGGLATGGYGTALGVIRALHAAGKLAHVWVDETRPYLQGARLTAWECLKDGLPATLITDSMAAHFMARGDVGAVIVGTDRVTANGDVANKIGTYALAVLCKHHGLPFYVAAPVSTIDLDTPTGAGIEIEQRSAREVTHVRGQAIAPEGIAVAHPAFDVTPAELVTAIITERGVIQAPYTATLRAAVT